MTTRKDRTSGNSMSFLSSDASGDTTPHDDNGQTSDREVEVWVRDTNGMRYPVKMPLSSTLIEVMQKAVEHHGQMGNFFPRGTFVGFQVGRAVGDWDERTTILQTLPDLKAVADVNQEDYLFEHAIQPKFKVRRVKTEKASAVLKRVFCLNGCVHRKSVSSCKMHVVDMDDCKCRRTSRSDGCHCGLTTREGTMSLLIR